MGPQKEQRCKERNSLNFFAWRGQCLGSKSVSWIETSLVAARTAKSALTAPLALRRSTCP